MVSSFIFSFYTPTTIGLFVKEDYEHLQGVLWLEGKDTVLPSVTPEGSTGQIIPIIFFFILFFIISLVTQGGHIGMDAASLGVLGSAWDRLGTDRYRERASWSLLSKHYITS